MMNCNLARETIELYFGHDELPDELQSHLAECASCRTYHGEMTPLASGLGSGSDIPFTADELDRAAAGVAERIGRQPTVVSSPARWLRPMLGVAAAVLVIGLSYGSYRLGQESNFGAGLDTHQTGDADVDRPTAFPEYDINDEMDEGLIGILIDDYCTDASYEATASLLDDISEEELEYLVENLEVGELL